MRIGPKHTDQYNIIIIDIFIEIIFILGLIQLLQMNNMNNIKEITPERVEITEEMSREEKEYSLYNPWTKNPKIIWKNTNVGSKRCEHELVIYCLSYQEDIDNYYDLLDGEKRISASKSMVLEYRQIFHPIFLLKSRELAMCMILGWIRNNVNNTLYPPEAVIHIIKIYVLEADCHFRITYYNPLEVIVNQRLWAEMDDYTDEEAERNGQLLLDQAQ